jgi:hypothetical protein
MSDMRETPGEAGASRTAPRPTRRLAALTRRPYGVAARVVALVAVAIVVLAGVGLVTGWRPSLPNPFEEETIDRSPPAVLRSLESLTDYHAASAHFEVVVDLEDDARYLPDALKGERALFVGVGTVDAVVDFGRLSGDAVTVSDDRLSAQIKLPKPALSKPLVDPERSYVFARQKGALDRLGGLFGGSGSNDQRFYVLAADKMTKAAKEDGSVLPLAERNTRAMLDGLLRGLGFTTVNVTYADNPA